jgi:outer membrane murein-binding lipoprotein Lpp
MPQLRRLEQACDLGNKTACRVLIKLRAAATKHFGIASDVIFSKADAHPNKMPFTGTLVLLGVPSTKPPHGAQGHRIQLSKEVTKRRLDDLISMGLNYAPSLDEHAPRRKVGVITGAWIEGNAVKVKGIIYKKDFPEAIRDLKTSGLGMSMELADVYVSDKDADVWQLDDFRFTGATVLFKKAAAYYQTALAAQRGRDSDQQGGKMKKQGAKKKVAATKGSEVMAAIIASAVKTGVAAAVQPLIENGQKTNKRLARMIASQEQMAAKLDESLLDMDDEDALEVAAAADEDDDVDADDEDDVDASADDDADEDEDDDEDTSTVRAAKKTKDDSADDDEDGYDDDEDDVEATEADPDMTDLNDDDVADKTKKTKSTGKVGKKVPKAPLSAGGDRLSAAAIKANRKLRFDLKAERERTQKLSKKVNKLHTQVETLNAQVDRYAETVDRRTISAEVRTLLDKAGHNVGDLVASGQKLTTAAVDKAFKDSGLNLDVVSRIALKNQLVQGGLMEQGEIHRESNRA